METIGEVIGKMNLPMELTSEYCMLHEVHSQGEVFIKKIQKIRYGEEVVCPVCEREKEDKKLAEFYRMRKNENERLEKYRMFSKNSIVTDEDLLNASFSNYEVVAEEEVNNKERATKAYIKYRDGERFNAWLTGDPGVGKSHLAMSILRNLNEQGDKKRSCLFINVEEMLRLIRNSFSDKESMYTESYFVELLGDADFLVLDDLGAETGGTDSDKVATDFTLRVLYSVANRRQNKSTLITTNLSRVALVKMYDPKLVSRLMKDTYLIKFEETTDKRINEIDF